MPAPVYADTSFLVSLYVQDANSVKVAAQAPGLLPIFMTALTEHELRNAIRLCVFRGQITATQREQALDNLESDKAAGVLHVVPLDWPKVFKQAEVLSRKHTETAGVRGMDILHVASALALKSKQFVTFDNRQSELARLAGLSDAVA